MDANRSIQDIAEKILLDQCIFICGSGLSAIAGPELAHQNIVKKFVEHYSNRFPDNCSVEELRDMSLPEVTQAYFNSLNLQESELTRVVTTINNNFLKRGTLTKSEPSIVHIMLANLGIKDVYTTNYDQLIEKAYREVGFQDFINIINQNRPYYKINENGFPNIYKLCGTVGKEGIILTKHQFETCLTHPHYPFMRQILGKSVVFIGYHKIDHTLLNPYIQFIKDCYPQSLFCVTSDKTDLPDGLKNPQIEIEYVTLPIQEFIARLYISLLSSTSKCFEYLSDKRKCIEKHGIHHLREEIGQVDISSIRRCFEDHQSHYSKVVNTWYYDHKFHCSIYDSLSKKIFARDFSEIYLKLRPFYSTYQTQSSLREHEEILGAIEHNPSKILDTLLGHLNHVTDEAYFWLRYINKLFGRLKLQNALQNYPIPLHSNEGMLTESFLESHSKIFVQGAGSDQTCYIKQQALLYFAKSSIIPVYIDFAEHDIDFVSIFSRQENFSGFLLDYFSLWDLPSENGEWIVKDREKSRKILLIVDGVDGFSSLSPSDIFMLARRIKGYHQNDKDMKVIVTSKNANLESANLADEMDLEEIRLGEDTVSTPTQNEEPRNRPFNNEENDNLKTSEITYNYTYNFQGSTFGGGFAGRDNHGDV